MAVEEPEPLGRGGGLRFAAQARREQGAVFALNGDELLDVDLSALLARHREREPAATITLVPLRSQFGVVDLDDDDVVTGFREAPTLPYWVNVGLYVLDDEALEQLPGARRPRDDDLPAPGRAPAPPRLPPPRHVADGQHAEGAAPGRGVRASNTPTGYQLRIALMGGSLSSPNLEGLDRFAFETSRVDKPWGYELIWALSEAYCGKVLFVRAGESLSLQFHREKDESWYVQSGRAELQVGAVGDAVLHAEVLVRGRGASASGPAPSTASRRWRTRRSSRSRRRRSTTSCGSRTRTAGRARPTPWIRQNLATLVVRFVAMDGLTVGQAAAQTGWSPRMLRYLERAALVVPRRAASGYRLYGAAELDQLRALRELRERFGLELTDVGFAARMRRDPSLRAEVEQWLSASGVHTVHWVDWEQRKHERLLAA